MHAAGGSDDDTVELFRRETRRPDLLSGTCRGCLYPPQPSVASNDPGEAVRRVAGQTEQDFRVTEHAIPPILRRDPSLVARHAAVIVRVTSRRQQVGLKTNQEPIVGLADEQTSSRWSGVAITTTTTRHRTRGRAVRVTGSRSG